MNNCYCGTTHKLLDNRTKTSLSRYIPFKSVLRPNFNSTPSRREHLMLASTFTLETQQLIVMCCSLVNIASVWLMWPWKDDWGQGERFNSCCVRERDILFNLEVKVCWYKLKSCYSTGQLLSSMILVMLWDFRNNILAVNFIKKRNGSCFIFLLDTVRSHKKLCSSRIWILCHGHPNHPIWISVEHILHEFVSPVSTNDKE
jgi:hypothetical protein